MERMGGFHRYRKHAKSSSTVLEVVQTNNTTTDATTKTATGAGDGAGNSTTNTTNNPQEPERALVCMVREQDQYMPIANVIRIMRRILPSHAKISDDAKETIQECVSEYISFVTGEANERCQREQRKTVTAEDILWAMGKLGFDDYVQPLTLFLSRYRDSESDRTSVRGEPPGAIFVKRGAAAAAEYGPVQVGVHGPYVPGFHVGHYPNVFDAPASAMGGYYRDGSGGAGTGSSAQNAMANFDPFAHFK